MIKVLVIEDDSAIASMLSDTLGITGYEVILANSGREGLARAEEMSPDIITLDLNMPGMDGFKVLESLKNNQNTSGIPVIITTVSENEKDMRKSYRLGARKYIVKPFPAEVLRETINEFV